jgi:thermitase
LDHINQAFLPIFPNLRLKTIVSDLKGISSFHITDETPVAEMLQRLAAQAGSAAIDWCEPNFIVDMAGFPPPNDPGYQYQWGLEKIGGKILWNPVAAANGVNIAIIDSGIPCDPVTGALQHPDLMSGIVLKNNYVNAAQKPFDDTGHGTHVTGICGADSNNGQGVTGVNWIATKFIYKVFGAGFVPTSDICAQAIEQAVKDAAAGTKLVINVSFGVSGAAPNVLEAACQTVQTAGFIICAATGNGGRTDAVDAPACFAASNDAVVAVGATDYNDRVAPFSNSRPGQVSLVAPGVGAGFAHRDHPFRAIVTGRSGPS